MNSTKEQIISFLDKCDELKSCKFIMATTKIKDLLKSIVNCCELYRLFEAVTKDFNYLEAKSQCLVSFNDGLLQRNYVVLPKTVGQRLAFIFCLLVEFDRETINFNDFLMQYYPEDGSFFASYQAFGNSIIKSLKDCVEHAFKDLLAVPEEKQNVSPVTALGLVVAQEMKFIASSSILEEDKENGMKILSALFESVKARDEEKCDALLCGYNYFVLHNNCVSDSIANLIKLVETCEKFNKQPT